LDGHEEDKDLEVDHSEDHQEEAEDCQEVEDRRQESPCLCHKHLNREGTTEIN
jgi:hypothetical protein